MLSWWLIAILVFVTFFAIFKSQDLVFFFSFIKKNLFPLAVIGILLFFSFSFYHIYKTNDFDLTSYNGVLGAGKVYFGWFGNLFSNVGRVTGYAINQDWAGKNATIVNSSAGEPALKTK